MGGHSGLVLGVGVTLTSCLSGWCFLSLPVRLLLVAWMPVLSLVEGCIGNLIQESRVGVASEWYRLGKHSIDRFGGDREFSETADCLLIKGVPSRSALSKARSFCGSSDPVPLPCVSLVNLLSLIIIFTFKCHGPRKPLKIVWPTLRGVTSCHRTPSCVLCGMVLSCSTFGSSLAQSLWEQGLYVGYFTLHLMSPHLLPGLHPAATAAWPSGSRAEHVAFPSRSGIFCLCRLFFQPPPLSLCLCSSSQDHRPVRAADSRERGHLKLWTFVLLLF